MFLESLQSVFGAAFTEVWAAFMSFLPLVVGALFVICVGALLARLLGSAVSNALTVLKTDELLEKIGFASAAKEWGIELRVSTWLGVFTRWFTSLVFFIAALNVLGLDTVTYFLEDVVYGFIPRVCVAVLIMVSGIIIGSFVRKTVEGGAGRLGVASPQILARAAEWSIMLFAAFAALTELGIAADFVRTLFTGIVVAFSMALGLSFGIGGQQAAADCIAELRQKYKK